jgi:hypothetical protein
MSVILLEVGGSLAATAAEINGNAEAAGRQVCHAADEPDRMAAQRPEEEMG